MQLTVVCLSSWFGVGGVILDWFKSYLYDCLQCVKIGYILSDSEALVWCAPGLCPRSNTLFFIYYSPQQSQVIHSYRFISHIRMWLMPLTG